MVNLNFIPDRFGVFTGLKDVISYTQKADKGKYTELLSTYKSQWESMTIPFGMSLKDAEGMCYGICIDVDAHNGEDITSILNQIKDFLQSFNYAFEHSYGGRKFWMWFSSPIPNTKLEGFFKFIERTYKVEVYPSKEGFIRFPGIYKDRVNYSLDMDTQEKLDTIGKVYAFLNKGINESSEFLRMISQKGLEESEKKEPKVRKAKGNSAGTIVSGMDDFFEAIWEHVTGTKVEINKQIKCPFHTEENASARIYQEGAKTLFCCFSENCKINNAKKNPGRDALDILHYYLTNTTALTTKSIDRCREYLYDTILVGLFKNCVMVRDSKVIVNFLKLADLVLEEMSASREIDCKKDHNGVLYRYNTEISPFWSIVTDPSQNLNVIVDITTKILEKMVGKAGCFYLGYRNIGEIAEIINGKLSLPENCIKEEQACMQIPFLNGILDLNKYLQGDPGCLIPHIKERFIVNTLNCNYIPGAENKEFIQCLRRYLPNDTHAAVFSEFVGVSMVPAIKVPQIMFCVGTGGNGKGTLLSMVSSLFGKQASSIKFHDLDDRFKVFEIYGKWVNIDPDSVMSSMTQKGISIVKTCTGDGSIIIERKREHPIQVTPTCKFIIACNQIPSLGDINEAIVRRFIEIPFRAKVPQNSFGGYWESIVNAEGGLSGIANLFLESLKRYIMNGKKFTTMVDEEATNKEEFFKESDPVYAYICSLFENDLNDPMKYPMKDSRLRNQELAAGVRTEQLFRDFRIYVEQVGIRRMIENISCAQFSRRLAAKISDKIIPEKYSKWIRKIRNEKVKGIYEIDVIGYQNNIQ